MSLEDDLIIHPSCWAKLAVHHTKKTCVASYLLPLVALVLIPLLGHFKFDDPSSIDFYVRDNIRTRLHDARTAARQQFELDSSSTAAEREASQGNAAINLLLRSKLSNSKLPFTDEQRLEAQNVFSRLNLGLLKEAEDLILNSSEYQSFCLYNKALLDCKGKVRACTFPKSVLNSKHLYGIWKNGTQCDRRTDSQPPSAEAFSDFLNALYVVDADGNKVIDPVYGRLLGNDFSPANPSTWLMRSVFEVGAPYTNFTSLEDRATEQEKRYLNWVESFKQRLQFLSTNVTDVSIMSLTYANSAFGDIALRDLSFCVVAIIIVFLLIWGHTGSAFLGTAAMGQIFMSFPAAYVLYRYLFQQRYFSALQILSIFLLLGIGADDVFVFTDAWKQSMLMLGPKYDSLARLSWTYKRAVRAMGVTSITTAAAFFVTATSPIMPISTLGFWAGILILVQFVLVITAYPCALIIWHRFWSTRHCLPCLPTSNDRQFPTMQTLIASILPNSWQEQHGQEPQYRLTERFFRGPWVKVIHKLRFVLIFLALALSGLGIFFAMNLQPIQKAEEYLPSSHPMAMKLNAIAKDFPATELEARLQVRLVWGIQDVDRSGTSRFEPENFGAAILDQDFDLRSEEAQQHLLNTCDFMENRSSLIYAGFAPGNPVECWIRDYQLWRRDILQRQEFQTFMSHEQQAEELLEFAHHSFNGIQPFKRHIESQQIAFDQNRSRVVFTELRFTTPLLLNESGKDVGYVYDEWIKVVDIVNGQGPGGANNCFVTGGSVAGTVEANNPWLWEVSQYTLVRSMFVGIGIMLAVSVLTLTFSTLNWIVSIMATLCIGGIVSMLLGVVYVMGWELGTTETIAVVISIGYSFDGVAHIATAYIESAEKSRLERTRDALFTLGVSIWFGCLTTLAASLLLFPAIITFFVKFAGMLISTVVLSLLWSLTLFPALLMVFGPTGAQGSLKAIWCKLFRRSNKESKDSARDVAELDAEERVG